MTCRELIRRAAERFSAAGIPDPVNDAALLLSHLTGRPPLSLRLDDESVPDPAVVRSFNALADKRLSRVPLQYLLGEAPFYGRMFKVDSRVLIPRPETELLCEWALSLLKDHPSPRILDLCCGSGCIGITLKKSLPAASVTLSDISPDALALSAENAAVLDADVVFCQSDLLESFSGSVFDLIISNPPYIPSAECLTLQQEVRQEPIRALDGGPDGLDIYRRIVREAFPCLVPGGHLLMELGAGEDQAVSSLLSAGGYCSTEIREDLAGIRRMILSAHP